MNLAVGMLAALREAEHPELLEDERCRSHNQRIEHREVTEDLLNAPVNSVREVAEDSHFAEYRNMFPRYVQPELGEVRVTHLRFVFRSGRGFCWNRPLHLESRQKRF